MVVVDVGAGEVEGQGLPTRHRLHLVEELEKLLRCEFRPGAVGEWEVDRERLATRHRGHLGAVPPGLLKGRAGPRYVPGRGVGRGRHASAGRLRDQDDAPHHRLRQPGQVESQWRREVGAHRDIVPRRMLRVSGFLPAGAGDRGQFEGAFRQGAATQVQLSGPGWKRATRSKRPCLRLMSGFRSKSRLRSWATFFDLTCSCNRYS